MTESFGEVLRRYAAAHNDAGTDKTTTHAYGPLYSSLFEPLRDSARWVMEVGVYSGAATAAMADFFTGATVVGLDVDLGRLRFAQDHPRVRYLRQDATSSSARADILASLGGVGASFDLILDDASHRKRDQLTAFEELAPLLRRDGGTYVIEDIMGDWELGSFRADLDALRVRMFGAERSKLEWYDMRKVRGVPDDIVAVVHV